VEAKDFPFEGFQTASCGLNQKEVFAGGFDFSFPAVDRLYRGDLDVDAGGEMFFQEGAGDFAGFAEGGARYENKTELSGVWHGARAKIVADFESGAGMRPRTFAISKNLENDIPMVRGPHNAL
jgi:hypothetical protein